MTLERGTLLHKRYRIVEILGQGGMGSVYRAVDENLGVDVAVKENLFTTDEYARQFRLEAVILANLRHANLTRVTDHFVIGDQGQYLVMDYIEGEDLRQRMERVSSISEEDAVLIGVAMCDALMHLHSRKPPILHRDVKPGNVKITPDGHIFLVDFGLAKILKGTQATTTGARAMTPGYSPPEQYGTARTDARTDIYSLGATLYAALSGVIPEDGLARAMDNVELTPLRKRNPRVSRRLAGVIEKAMAVKADDRYQTAEEFRQALISSNSKTLHLNGDILVDPPPVFNGREDIKEPPDKPVTGSLKPNSQPLPPASPVRKKGMGKGLWVFISFSLLIVLMAVVGVPYFWVPIFRIIDQLRSTSTTVSLSTTTPLRTDPNDLPVTSATSTGTQTPASTVLASKTPLSVTARTGTTPPILIPSNTPTPTITPEESGIGQIAFASNRSGKPQVYVMSIGSDDPQQITNLEEGACQPDWSPDGQRLVFTSPCLKKEEGYPGSGLYLINADGSGLTALPTVAGGDFDPAWSPDGTRIAFTSLRDGFDQIYKIDLNNNLVERLTQTDSTRPTRQPAWNPLASQIVYSQKKYDAWEIWVMTDLGTGPMRLVFSSPDNWDTQPIWSVDDATILFTQAKKLSATSWLMEILYSQRETGKATAVPNGVYASNADYSTDGLWLVFENMDGVNGDIYILTVTGEQRQRITSDPALDFDPAWRPLP
jgi:serine/threonine protein kinase